MMEKVAVIMTDGNNEFHDRTTTSTDNNSVPASDFTGYGRIETLNGNSNGKESAARRRPGHARQPDGRHLRPR